MIAMNTVILRDEATTHHIVEGGQRVGRLQALFLLHAPIDGHRIWQFPASNGLRLTGIADVFGSLGGA
jgi:hypothetical protein